MGDITNEVTVRLDLGQRALEDSRERAIRGLIVGKVPSNLRRLGPKCQGYSLMTYWCSEDCGEQVGRGYNG